MVRSVRGNINQGDPLPNLNKCIVHILDLNINHTKEYLLSAWSTKSIGSHDFYLANVNGSNQLQYLNFSEIFDFQRIAIVNSSTVRIVSK